MSPFLALAAAISLAVQPPTAAELADDQRTVIDYILQDTPAEGIDVRWEACGTQNAWYYRGGGPIVLCLELNETSATAFVAAHEAGHALVEALELDVGAGGFANERAADELGALFLIEMGRYDDVVGGAKWFMRNWDPESHDGVHPSHAQRVRDLLCLVDGAETAHGARGSLECLVMFKMTWVRWSTAINAALNPE